MRHFVSCSESWRQSISKCLHYEETECLSVFHDETKCLLVSYMETKCLLIKDVETLCPIVSLSDVNFDQLYWSGQHKKGKSCSSEKFWQTAALSVVAQLLEKREPPLCHFAGHLGPLGIAQQDVWPANSDDSYHFCINLLVFSM